jgi:hypothetical protein
VTTPEQEADEGRGRQRAATGRRGAVEHHVRYVIASPQGTPGNPPQRQNAPSGR